VTRRRVIKLSREPNSLKAQGSIKGTRNSGRNLPHKFGLLLDTLIILQQSRVIAQNLQDAVLLHLIDMAMLQIDESINRHLYPSCQLDASGRLN
jgi:hypothetical protein